MRYFHSGPPPPSQEHGPVFMAGYPEHPPRYEEQRKAYFHSGPPPPGHKEERLPAFMPMREEVPAQYFHSGPPPPEQVWAEHAHFLAPVPEHQEGHIHFFYMDASFAEQVPHCAAGQPTSWCAAPHASGAAPAPQAWAHPEADKGWAGIESPQERTTTMLRNLPSEYDRSELLRLLNREGFAGLYDFVYLPMDFRSNVCFGYGFINFVSSTAAEQFRQHFEGFSNWSVPSDKIAEVSWSDPIQGLEAHIERYRNSPLMHEAVPDMYKPVLLNNGIRINFPPPSKKLRAPRVRHARGNVAGHSQLLDD